MLCGAELRTRLGCCQLKGPADPHTGAELVWMVGCTARRGLSCACRSRAEPSLELRPVIPHPPAPGSGHTGKTSALFLCNDSSASFWPQTSVQAQQAL